MADNSGNSSNPFSGLGAIPIAGSVLQLGTGIAGLIGSGQQRSEAEQTAQIALDKYKSIGMPPDLSYPLVLQELKQQGVLTPQLEQAINLQQSQESQIKENPATQNAQMNALDMLRQRAGQGYTAQERAAYNKVRGQVQSDVQGKLGQIQQNFQARGQGGAGAELAAQLSAAQSGAARAQEAGDTISANAAQNALSAMGQYGSLAGQVRGQDFSIADAKARAADLVNQFNAQQAIGRQSRNVGAQNVAQERNLGEKQRVSDYNTAMANAEKARQLAAKGTQYGQSLDYARGLGQAAQPVANMQAANAQATGQSFQNVGAGIGQIASSLGNYGIQQDDKQRQLKDSVYSTPGLLSGLKKYKAENPGDTGFGG